MKTTKYKMVITYKDETWTNVFDLYEGEDLTDVIVELQDDWSEHIGSTITDFDGEQYDCQTYLHN